MLIVFVTINSPGQLSTWETFKLTEKKSSEELERVPLSLHGPMLMLLMFIVHVGEHCSSIN